MVAWSQGSTQRMCLGTSVLAIGPESEIVWPVDCLGRSADFLSSRPRIIGTSSLRC